MDIGKPQRIIRVEPLTVPDSVPDPTPEPAREPVKEPAKTSSTTGPSSEAASTRERAPRPHRPAHGPVQSHSRV